MKVGDLVIYKGRWAEDLRGIIGLVVRTSDGLINKKAIQIQWSNGELRWHRPTMLEAV